MKGSLKINEQSWAIEAKIKKEVGGGGVKWVTLFIKPWHYFRENFCSHPNLETRPLFIIKMPTFSSNPSKRWVTHFTPLYPISHSLISLLKLCQPQTQGSGSNVPNGQVHNKTRNNNSDPEDDFVLRAAFLNESHDGVGQSQSVNHVQNFFTRRF